MEEAERRALFDYWIAVEILNPQIIKLEEQPGAFGGRRLVRDDSDLPWPEVPEEPANQVIFFTVYLELTEVHRIDAEMAARFGSGEGDAERPRDGRYGLGAFIADGLGQPIPGSFEAASLPWGMGRLAAGSMDMRGFRDFANAMRSRFNQYCERLRQPLTADHLRRISDGIIEAAGWQPPGPGLTALVTRQIKHRRQGQGEVRPDRPALLNSFYLEDLEALAQEPADRLSACLRRYLSGIDPGHRADLARQADRLRPLLAPRSLPVARWPAAHDLVLMQQAAVNAAAALGEAPGLFSVNGPPGTGKTTLLRDVVAKVVVDRAKVLAGAVDPLRLFVADELLIWQGRSLRWHRLDAKLLGHEMIVASTSNAAVDNVTRVLPARDSLPASGFADLDYFKATAQALFESRESEGDRNDDDGQTAPGESEEAPPPPPDVWGLIAAPLGKAANRYRFHEALRWDRFDRSLWKLLQAPPKSNWAQARADFAQALERVEALQRAAEAVAGNVTALATEQAQQVRLADRLAALARERDDLCSSCADREAGQASLIAAETLAEAALARILAGRPGWLARLCRSASARDHERRLGQHRASLREARDRLDNTTAATARALGRIAEIEVERAGLEREMALVDSRCADIQTAIACYDEAGGGVGDAAFWAQDEDVRQRQLPWITPEWQAARAELFARAIELHAAFAYAARGPYLRNLGLALDFLRQGALHDGVREALPHLLATLFTCVPVVSTTFASFHRMFGAVTAEGLGWLLIDEAGQALPQAAAGAIQRSRRVIVVGDPQQIEPIMPLPQPVLQAMAEHYGIEPAHDARVASAQTLGDRANPLGTELADRWVGCPLRVHRRCARTMFEIANEIAYGGTMIFDSPAHDELAAWPASGWLDVPGVAFEGHYSPAEGEVLASLLDEAAQETEHASLFVITPFRDVATAIRRQRILPPRQIGTIHGFQGRESDIVCLVLGGSTPGARHWAGRQPNILNVAVTRARARLYVIGDRRCWREAGYFSVLDRALANRELPIGARHPRVHKPSRLR